MATSQTSPKPKRAFGVMMRTTPERRREVYDGIAEMSTPRRSFYVMVAVSTTIAAYGLLSNSTAVVIGAMLLAPLMGPIFGVALSLTVGNKQLLRQAIFSEFWGMLLAVLLGALIGMVPLRMDFGSEILARTQPTLYDIVIALVSGLAGAYALMDAKISSSLPGVAIATALVPPLAVSGLCLSSGRWDLAGGAFLLFFANFLAIHIASAFVFIAYGMTGTRKPTPLQARAFLQRFGVSLTLLLLITAFMTHTLMNILAQRRFANEIEKTLSSQVRSTVGASLTATKYDQHANGYDVVATVLTPQEFTPDQIANLEDKLRSAVGPNVHLIVRSLISRDADRNGPAFIADAEREKRAEVAEQTDFLSHASSVLTTQIKRVAGGRLIDLRREDDEAGPLITAVVRTPTVITPEDVKTMQDALQRADSKPVRLIVRSIRTHDADAQRFIYEAKPAPAPLEGAELQRRIRVARALQNQIALRIPAARLAEMRARPLDGRYLVLAIVRTPRQLTPPEVKIIEDNLRRFIEPRIALIVRSQVGTDASANGYRPDFDDSQLID